MAGIYKKICFPSISSVVSCSACISESLSRRGPRKGRSWRQFSTSGGLSSESSANAQYITNSMTRQKEQLNLSTPPVLRWYSCGPTVYDSSHLGHAYAYMQFDLIRRALESFHGINVMQVMNITDIDDKIIKRANETGVSWTQVSKTYEAEFLEDIRSLGIKAATVTAKVTNFIPEIVQFIQKLISDKTAYVTPSGSVYFDTKAYGRYGKFRSPSQENEKHDESEKRSVIDFALWKGVKPNEPSWPTPFSHTPGRPGWHIECSTLASHFFGSSLDLHSGGRDLLFPHHENEEAQCCAFHQTEQWAGQWIHTGHLLAPDETKMAKSDKNFISIRDYLDQFTADQFRMFCLRHHYRSNCTYSEEEIRIATDSIAKFTNFSNTVDAYLTGVLPPTSMSVNEGELFNILAQTQSDIRTAVADDFDFPLALQHLAELVSKCHKQLTPNYKEGGRGGVRGATTVFAPMAAAVNLTESFFQTCGFTFPSRRHLDSKGVSEGGGGGRRDVLPDVMAALLEFRSSVRQTALHSRKETPAFSQSVLSACDRVRSDLLEGGVLVKDLPNGSTWEVSEQSLRKKTTKRKTE